MKLRVIIETVEDMLSAVAQRHSITTEQVKSTAVLISSKYWKWLLKLWYKGDINLYNLSLEKAGSIKDLMRRFNEAPKDGRDADINTFQSIDDLERFLALVVQRQIAQFESGAEVLFKTNTYIIYSVNDAEVLKLIGEGTKWCTRGSYPQCAAHSYLYRHDHIFVITKDHKPFIQFTPDLAEIQWANNTRLNRSKLEELLSEMGTDLDDILAKGTEKQETANICDEAKLLYKLIKSIEENTYNLQNEVPVANFLIASATSLSLQEFGIIFDHLVTALQNAGLRGYEIRDYYVRTHFEGSAIKEDVVRALNAVVQKVCDSLVNRPKNQAYPSMREAILVLHQTNQPMVGRLAGAYDTYVGRHFESEDERRPIREIAAESIDGIVELKHADGQRVPEGERRLLNDAISDIRSNAQVQEDGEVPWYTQSIDDLIDYYEIITNIASLDPNRPEALQVNKSIFNAFRWPEYEQVLAAYPVYSPSHTSFLERFTTWLNSISSYMVINQITTKDIPKYHQLALNYLQRLCEMYQEDRAVFLHRFTSLQDAALIDTLVNYIGLAADRSDAQQMLDLLNQYREITPDSTMQKLQTAALTPNKISYSRFMTIR